MQGRKKHSINSLLQYKSSEVLISKNNLNSSNSNNCDINTSNSNQEVPINKSLDTYFGISEKSPSPSLNSDIDEEGEDTELNINDTLTLTEIKSRIENLYETELIEIYRIIKGNGERYTTNNNGIFVNICNLKLITISEITQFLIYSEKKNKEIDKEEEERDLYRVIVS